MKSLTGGEGEAYQDSKDSDGHSKHLQDTGGKPKEGRYDLL